MFEPHAHEIPRRAVIRLVLKGLSRMEDAVVVDEEKVAWLGTDDYLVLRGNLLNKIESLPLLWREGGEALCAADSVESEERLACKV
jgi:hypothetical protein